MRWETSYGVIPLLRNEKGWKLFLIQHRRDRFWGFPKGHGEEGESPLETAERELYEESGLHVLQLLREEPLLEEYTYQHQGIHIEKKVYFFLAITSEKFTLDIHEVVDGKWLSFQKAKELISFREGQELVCHAERILKTL